MKRLIVFMAVTLFVASFIPIRILTSFPLEVEPGFGTIAGTVTNDKGKAVQGATIKVVGTTKGAVSKADGSFLYTIAKDVKLQVEFNPITVAGYRLIGYEDRILANEDFANDLKDAGDLGAGHSVTALYEIVPARRAKDEAPQLSDARMRYQTRAINPEAYMSNELMDIRLRYKLPNDSASKLIEHPITDRIVAIGSASESFRFAAAVAELGMLLRDSKYKGSATYDSMLELARGAPIRKDIAMS